MTAAQAQNLTQNALTASRDARADRAEWDAYVRAHPQGSFFHLSGWGAVIEEAYGYEPVYITVRRDGRLAGVLPLIDIRAPLLGRSLVSTGFTVGGGPLADDDEALERLLSAAAATGEERRVQYIECRSNFAAGDAWLEKPSTAALFRLPLPDNEEIALKAIPKRRRADIRKALKAVDEGRLAVCRDGDPDVFYDLYADSLRRLGTPVFPRKFLHALLDAFERQTEISVISHGGAPVGALLTFHYDGIALPYYVGATESARALHAFDYLYWSVMRHAIQSGYSTFDFGRSRIGGGAYKYKKLWGIEPKPLTYRVKLIKAAELPNVSPNNPKFKLFSSLWPRLPSPVANRLGPLLAPNFP